MYIIDQLIANEIARKMAVESLKNWFLAREEEVEEMEAQLINELAIETGSCIVGVAVTAILPLLVEHEAITSYILETGERGLRLNLPEISTVKEARELAEKEFNLTAKQSRQVEEKLNQLWSQLRMAQAQ
jgi:hypothetical protein